MVDGIHLEFGGFEFVIFPQCTDGTVYYLACQNAFQDFKSLFLVPGRVRLLFSKGHSCFRERRTGERRRKSVRGCIVDANLSVLAVVVIKKGEQVCWYLNIA